MTDFPFPLFTYCKFIINDKIPNNDGELFKMFTNTFNFKISSFDPLIIEKDWPSQEDLTKLVKALKSLTPPNSKSCDLEERQGESFELLAAKENVESGDSEQMLSKQKNGYEQLTKHTQTTCDDARNTDIQALGTNDDKHDLIKVHQGLKANEVSAGQEKSVSANKVFENISSENITFEENAMVSLHSKRKDVLQIKQNTTDEEKEIPASQVATAGPNKAEELIHKISHAEDDAALLSLEGVYENPATRLLERNKHDIQRNIALRKSENNETVYKNVKSPKSENDVMDATDPQPHKLAHRKDALPKGPLLHNVAFGTYSGDNERNIFTKTHSAYYVRSERSKLKVHILKSDITRLDVDCIVNATNRRLINAGGVSKAISLAAGPALNRECEAFINSGNKVSVTDIFLSTGGNLPAKFVMHAVGPKWDAYDNKSKPQCFDALRHTVIRCLVEAGRQGFTSIALPSISSAMLKVPMEACARCYMEAVKHFATFNEEKTSLREIDFVDVDDAMVKVIKEHFEKNWTDPCDPHIVQKDCDFASTHFYSTTRNAAKHIGIPPGTKMTYSSVPRKTLGASKSLFVPEDRQPGNTVTSTSKLRTERSSSYQIGKYTLHTDTRPAFDLSSDITITVGKPFDKLSGLHNFSVSDNSQTKENVKNKYKLFHVSEPKSHHQKQLCALLPEPDNAETIKEAIENLDIILQSPNHKIFTQNIRKVVLASSILYKEPNNTLIRTSQSVYDRKNVRCFMRCLFDYLNHGSQITGSSISITLVGSEDALQILHTVIESRGAGKVSPEAAGSSADLDTCEICVSKKPIQPVKCCGKCICLDCQQRMSKCPFCCSFWSILIGDQPTGTMTVHIIDDYADGYQHARALKIEYTFPSGIQKKCHPNPGAPYTGVSRKAFLPATKDGFHVLKLLRLAFLRKLTFTIGRSLTMDRENAIVWNDIHHKTSLHGGVYGYPDPNYLLNVTQELANKGVTFETVSADEKRNIEDFENHIVTFKHFTDTH